MNRIIVNDSREFIEKFDTYGGMSDSYGFSAGKSVTVQSDLNLIDQGGQVNIEGDLEIHGDLISNIEIWVTGSLIVYGNIKMAGYNQFPINIYCKDYYVEGKIEGAEITDELKRLKYGLKQNKGILQSIKKTTKATKKYIKELEQKIKNYKRGVV